MHHPWRDCSSVWSHPGSLFGSIPDPTLLPCILTATGLLISTLKYRFHDTSGADNLRAAFIPERKRIMVGQCLSVYRKRLQLV